MKASFDGRLCQGINNLLEGVFQMVSGLFIGLFIDLKQG